MNYFSKLGGKEKWPPPDSQEYFKSAFSVDNVIFGFDGTDLRVLLINRAFEPFVGYWALPGDLVYPHEDLDEAVQRVLTALTGLKDVFMEQVKTFGEVDRHPDGRVITIAYYSLIDIRRYTPNPNAAFASSFKWHKVGEVSELAFDHMKILDACYERLKQKVRSQPIGFELLPDKFTLSQLRQLYEAILEQPLDKRNFRKKILSMNLLVDLDEMQKGVAHRPAKLYRFDYRKYKELISKGFNFDL
jgi:8-oxo-dGTP diphosphatase